MGEEVLEAWLELKEQLYILWHENPEAADAATLEFLTSLEHLHLRWVILHLVPERAKS